MRKLRLLMVVSLLMLAGSAGAQEEFAAGPGSDVVAPPSVPATRVTEPAIPVPATRGTRLTVGADAAFQLPVGPMADRIGVGFGGLVRGEYRLIAGLSAGLRVGYVYLLEKRAFSIHVDYFPIWAGVKYFITDMVYAGAELGVNLIKTKYPAGGDVSMDNSRHTRYGAGVGSGVLLGDVEARVQFQLLSFDRYRDWMALMLSVGYNFLKL